MLRSFWVGCLLGAMVFLGGCSDKNKPKLTKVSGTVLLDGQPLKDGQVTLVPESGGSPDVLPVKDGAFEGNAKVGKVKVQILAFRPPTPEEKPSTAESEPSPVNFLPARFNSESKITAEVAESGLTPSEFKVEKE